jgi:hypothetical protein
MDISKDNKILWNIETTPLNEKAYELILVNTERLNNELSRRNEDKRCSYITLKDFLINIKKGHLKHFVKEANIYLRKEKIKKLKI